MRRWSDRLSLRSATAGGTAVILPGRSLVGSLSSLTPACAQVGAPISGISTGGNALDRKRDRGLHAVVQVIDDHLAGRRVDDFRCGAEALAGLRNAISILRELEQCDGFRAFFLCRQRASK